MIFPNVYDKILLYRAVAWIRIKRLSKEPIMSQKLSELITLLRGHRVFIQTHNFPDPDAIASAIGLQYLLRRFGITTTICHHGGIERTATANMVADFGISMTTDVDIKDMTEDDYIITVDSQ